MGSSIKSNAAASDERQPLLYEQHPVTYNDDDLHTYKRKGETFNEFFKKMYLFSTFSIFVLVYFVCVFTKPTPHRFDYEKINTIVSFGDSYSTRFLNMDSLTYACRDCTSAGGPNWVIYLSEATQWISFDFAYNSAPVNNTIVSQVPTVIDISTQIQSLYSQVFVSPTKKISAIVNSKYNDTNQRTPHSTLTTIWVGINDIDLTYNRQDTDSLDLLIMQHYQALIVELLNQGVNQLMLLNVPPIDRAPMWHNTVHQELIKSRVIDFNKKLNIMIHNLRKSHNSAVFFHYDAWSYFHELLDHADKYNISDINDFCRDWSHPIENKCKDIKQYFWLNDLHPTFRVHELLAQDMKDFLSSQ